jgi:hypothetical protein
MKYPLAKYSEDPVTTYPLTTDELRALAVHWTYEHLDTSVYCTLFGTVGSTDLLMWDYTKDRFDKITAILGQDEMDTVVAEVKEKMRQRLGDEVWTAFREGRAILGDDALAEGEVQIKEVRNE